MTASLKRRPIHWELCGDAAEIDFDLVCIGSRLGELLGNTEARSGVERFRELCTDREDGRPFGSEEAPPIAYPFQS
jgi:hypothetical protein